MYWYVIVNLAHDYETIKISVQIVNMQETKSQIINHIRIMIEEAEHPNGKVKVSLKHYIIFNFFATETVCFATTLSCNDVL